MTTSTRPTVLEKVLDVLAREPVLLVGTVTAWVAVLHPSELVMAATVATGTYVARLLSKSKRTAAEDVEGARYVGALENAAGSAAPEPPPGVGTPPTAP